MKQETIQAIHEIFKDVKHDDDGMRYAQDVLNYVETFRSKIGQTLAMKRRGK